MGTERCDFVLVDVNPSSTLFTAEAGDDVDIEDTDNSGFETVTLDRSRSGGNIVAWDWSWPAGSISGEVVDVDFPIGLRTVTLTVTDNEGQKATDTLDINISYGCAPESRPNLLPLTLPLPEIYGNVQIGFSADTFFIAQKNGRWSYTQGTNCNPGIILLTYDDSNNDQSVYYEKISLLTGYSGTMLFQIFENEQLVSTQILTY